MPELPEAETQVRGLRTRIVGERIASTEVVHDDLLRVPVRAFRAELKGRKVTAVERRAKNVVIVLDAGDRRLVVNLGMTGGLRPLDPADDGEEPSHVAVRIRFESGRLLAYRDVRRFGALEVLDPHGWAELDARLGPEPLADDFRATDLHEGLRKSRSPLRSWLLDQRKIAGVGNIYANEAAWYAQVHPARPAREVTRDEATELHRGLRKILREAVDRGGTTLRDYRDPTGRPGGFGGQLRVYGRDGEPCSRCGDLIERFVFSNRSAYRCPTCQPR